MSELINEISNTINLIEKQSKDNVNSLDFTFLRKLSEYCYQLLLDEKHKNNESVVAFFLFKYIENLMINFGGDSIYNEDVQQSKTKIYEEILEGLRDFVKSLNSNDISGISSAMQTLITTYYYQVNHINNNYKTKQ